MAPSDEQSTISYYANRFRSRVSERDRSREQQSSIRSRIHKLEKINEELRKEIRRDRDDSSQRLAFVVSDGKTKDDNIRILSEKNDKMIEEKEYLEKWSHVFEEDQISMEAKLLEAQTDFKDLLRDSKRIDCLRDRALSMLRNTASLVCSRSDGADEKKVIGFDGEDVDEETIAMIRPFAAALEAVENAFEGRERKMKEMEKAIEVLSGNDEEEEGFVDVEILLGVERGLERLLGESFD
ncbi:uncharacterized protein LOC131228580 [Magnolia sinica]|uniref:uncharacterized protein LOC131228580 n=1 Tax=Magnolia sinica TaxID=86752 RepID=UPI0026589B3B|nr:uncharacterized protein LOC131228580 [Magnolia sinica]